MSTDAPRRLGLGRLRRTGGEETNTNDPKVSVSASAEDVLEQKKQALSEFVERVRGSEKKGNEKKVAVNNWNSTSSSHSTRPISYAGYAFRDRLLGSLTSFMDRFRTEKLPTPAEKLLRHSHTGQIHLPAEYDDMCLSLRVIDAEKLDLNPYIIHPIVRVHIVDLETGKYLSKGTSHDQPVVTRFEGLVQMDEARRTCKEMPCDFIIPMMTRPYDLRQIGEPLPEWNEEFLLNEDFKHFIDPRTLILFEVLDFGAKAHTDRMVNSEGFYPIAWAFMKPLGLAGRIHSGTCKLQLYRYTYKRPAYVHHDVGVTRIPDVFYSFNWFRREKYNSFLRVGFQPVQRPEPSEDVPVPMNALESELISKSYAELDRQTWQTSDKKLDGGDIDESNSASVRKRLQLLSRQRLNRERCEVPQKLLYKLEGGTKGCFKLAFSRGGRWLAAACTDAQETAMKIFDMESGRVKFLLKGHHDLVYDLSWSPDDLYLLSSSSDTTSKIWRIGSHNSELQIGIVGEKPEPVATATSSSGPGTHYASLQHTTYVYSGQFHPLSDANKLVCVTGAFDGVLRVWQIEQGVVHLLGEIKEHTHHINTTVFDQNGRLYSGDADGTIFVWDLEVHSRFQYRRSWTIKERELEHSIINSMTLQPPEERRILVHTRDNSLRLLELGRTVRVTKAFSGLKCESHNLKSTLSPDGKYVLSGSEDGKAYLWDAANGKIISTKHWQVGFADPVVDVSWNPTQHMVALCSYGREYPILVYVFEKDVRSIRDIVGQEDVALSKLMSRDVKKKDATERLGTEKDTTRTGNLNRLMSTIRSDGSPIRGAAVQAADRDRYDSSDRGSEHGSSSTYY